MENTDITTAEKLLDRNFYQNNTIWTPYKIIEKNVIWIETRVFSIDKKGFPTNIDILELPLSHFENTILKYGIELK